ncbi:AAA family ATPase [Rathayibacter soli]|uniref:AAA family ATPase n=1 Tax=Rathayibacter soli TaxID=3144168 RepID=UPI0027E532C2|nr:regulator [Glaciibacter superstes]
MSALVLALDAAVEDRIIADLIAAGHIVVARVQSAGELTDAVARGEAEVALVSASRRRLTERVLAACDEHGVRLVALTSGELERRHAATLGLFEVVEENASFEEIERLMRAGTELPLRMAATSAAPRAAGTTIAVWGPAGAPGRTTLAINLAAEIAAHGHTVALADADSYGGTVAPALGMLDEAPGFAAACRLAGTESLTRQELERIATRYNSPQGAFWVLTGIGRPSRWSELSAERVSTTIAACVQWVDYVVIDTGFSLESDEEISSDLFAPRRNAATLAALRAADRVVAVGLADPVGMSRFLRSHVELIEVVPDVRISIVMNRVRASAVGLNPRGQVASTLGRFAGLEAAALLPEDRIGLDTAVLTGRTLRDAAPKSPVRAALIQLIESELLPAPVVERTRRSARLSHSRRKNARIVTT